MFQIAQRYLLQCNLLLDSVVNVHGASLGCEYSLLNGFVLITTRRSQTCSTAELPRTGLLDSSAAHLTQSIRIPAQPYFSISRCSSNLHHLTPCYTHRRLKHGGSTSFRHLLLATHTEPQPQSPLLCQTPLLTHSPCPSIYQAPPNYRPTCSYTPRNFTITVLRRYMRGSE